LIIHLNHIGNQCSQSFDDFKTPLDLPLSGEKGEIGEIPIILLIKGVGE